MPTQVEPQPQADPRTSSEAHADPGSVDEAIRAFNQRAKSQAQDEPEPPADEPADDADPEAEVADPDDADPKDELVEVEFEGEHFNVPPKLKDALLRQSDYSRKMNAVAATEKDYAQRMESAEKLIEGAEQLAKVKAEALSLDVQLKQFETVDWTALEQSDPARSAVLAVKFLRLQQARADATAAEKSIDAALVDGRKKALQAKQAEMLKVLAKDFPAWGDEAGARVTTYAKSVGYSDEEIGRIADARLVIALDKARKFDAIQAGKAAAQGKVRDAQPVAKPGTPRRADPVADVRARFQKSTSPEDAEALFHAMAGGKRR